MHEYIYKAKLRLFPGLQLRYLSYISQIVHAFTKPRLAKYIVVYKNMCPRVYYPIIQLHGGVEQDKSLIAGQSYPRIVTFP